MTTKQSAFNWIEIPSLNFERAVTFYSEILGKPLYRETLGGIPNGVLPYDSGDGVHAFSGGPGGVPYDSSNAGLAHGGAVIYDERVKPGMNGSTPYLNCNGQLHEVVGRVEMAGGKILLPVTPIGFGSIAIIVDSEGNRMGLHST